MRERSRDLPVVPVPPQAGPFTIAVTPEGMVIRRPRAWEPHVVSLLLIGFSALVSLLNRLPWPFALLLPLATAVWEVLPSPWRRVRRTWLRGWTLACRVTPTALELRRTGRGVPPLDVRVPSGALARAELVLEETSRRSANWVQRLSHGPPEWFRMLEVALTLRTAAGDIVLWIEPIEQRPAPGVGAATVHRAAEAVAQWLTVPLRVVPWAPAHAGSQSP